MLAVKTIVLMTITILVLVVLAYFITIQAGSQTSTADANRVFSTKCQEYRSKDCSWAVTAEADFNDFMNACRFLYGNEREAFSCLYVFCPACKDESIGTANLENGLRCASICNQCAGDSDLNLRTTCCQQLASQCTGTSCSACA